MDQISYDSTYLDCVKRKGMKMELIIVKDYNAMSALCFERFKDQIQRKKQSVLSYTTGATPEGLLVRLAEAVNAGLDISECTFFNLDEYVGKKSDRYTVDSFMHRYFYDRIQQQPKRKFLINGETDNISLEIERYTALLKEYPRDIQLLGLGVNGHIGANEPGTAFDSSMFCADSHDSTINATKELFGLTLAETPTQMITMGFQEIMAAACVILCVSGAKKADAVQKVVEGEITPAVPASYLKNHPNFVLIVDEAAASLLKKS